MDQDAGGDAQEPLAEAFEAPALVGGVLKQDAGGVGHLVRERAAMVTAANRLEAERTRLRLTLKGLQAQVARTQALHGTAAGNTDELRRSLERLAEEVGAVAEALDAPDKPQLPEPVAPIESPSPTETAGGRERVR